VSDAPQVEYLSIPQLAVALTKVFGQPVHADRIRRRVKMGLPHHTDRCTGYPKFILSEVLSWWMTPAPAKTAATA